MLVVQIRDWLIVIYWLNLICVCFCILSLIGIQVWLFVDEFFFVVFMFQWQSCVVIIEIIWLLSLEFLFFGILEKRFVDFWFEKEIGEVSKNFREFLTL